MTLKYFDKRLSLSPMRVRIINTVLIVGIFLSVVLKTLFPPALRASVPIIEVEVTEIHYIYHTSPYRRLRQIYFKAKQINHFSKMLYVCYANRGYRSSKSRVWLKVGTDTLRLDAPGRSRVVDYIEPIHDLYKFHRLVTGTDYLYRDIDFIINYYDIDDYYQKQKKGDEESAEVVLSIIDNLVNGEFIYYLDSTEYRQLYEEPDNTQKFTEPIYPKVIFSKRKPIKVVMEDLAKGAIMYE
jgi:hypothetical protein